MGSTAIFYTKIDRIAYRVIGARDDAKAVKALWWRKVAPEQLFRIPQRSIYFGGPFRMWSWWHNAFRTGRSRTQKC